MKYLVQYKDFYSFKLIWQLIEVPQENGIMKYYLSKGAGQITSSSLDRLGMDYYGEINKLKGMFKVSIVKDKIKLINKGYAHESFPVSIPEKYKYIPLYTLNIGDITTECIMIPEQAYSEFNRDCKAMRKNRCW
jgi:hypothetical protein